MIDFITDLVKKAGDIIISEKKRLVVEKKSRREIVTNADIAAQKFINQSILRKYPNHNILGEESYDPEKDYQKSSDLWLIDPIDGTTNFAQGTTDYGVSIAYYKNNQPEVGVIYFPEKNMLFTAEKNKGTKHNGSMIKVGDKKDLKNAVIGSLFAYDLKKIITTFDMSKMLYPHIKTMRFSGCAVLDFCYVAGGFLDGMFGFALKPWDMAAGVLIAQEAGALVSTPTGNNWSVFQPEILVANKYLHHQLVNLFRKFLS